jgi:hypothetical protein
LVLLDLAMPDMNGIEAARRMSAIDPAVPIIMFTGLNIDGLESVARNAGVCASVSKANAGRYEERRGCDHAMPALDSLRVTFGWRCDSGISLPEVCTDYAGDVLSEPLLDGEDLG